MDDEDCEVYDSGEEPECLVCGGEGFMDNPDPLWYGFVPEIPCTSCGGSGLAKDMTWC
jgi:DnaJ-class molecular chaperone